MSAAWAVTVVELRRFLRDRSNIFFTFIFPLLLVVVIGAQFGGGTDSGRVVLTDDSSALGQRIATELDARDVTIEVAAAGQARETLARGRADAGVLIDDADAAAFDAGDPVHLDLVLASTSSSSAVAQLVQSAVAEVDREQAGVTALQQSGVDPGAAQDAWRDAEEQVPSAGVEVVDVNDVSQAFAGVTGFDVGASSQVLLFVFLTALAGSATLIDARRHRVIARTLAAPVSAGSVVAGQALGRWAIAFFQGVYVMVGTSLLFGVTWGNVGLCLLVLAVFSTVAAGAAMAIGSLLDNEGAASGLGVGLALVLAALGGCMVPQEIFPASLQFVASLTPHGWGYRAFAEIQRHGGTLADIAGPLGVLVGFAVVVLVLGSLLLRRSVARAL
ncbi:MAG TPA: ABC transporter permease [Ruania sp.]|nr:ABC transporter permease [Ruania sp.]